MAGKAPSPLVKIELVGCVRYSYKSEKFARGVHYMVRAERAKLLLRLTTDGGLYVFKRVGETHIPVAPKPVPVPRQIPVVDTTMTPAEQYDAALGDSEELPEVVLDDDLEDSASEILEQPLAEDGEELPEEGTPI